MKIPYLQLKNFLFYQAIAFLIFLFHLTYCFSQCIAEAGKDTAICVAANGLPIIFLGGNPTAQYGNPPYIYSWSCDYWIGTSLHFSASDFLHDTTSANPLITSPTPDSDSLTFFLEVTDSTGNVCNDSVIIKFCKFVFTLEDKKAFITQGDTIQLYPGVGVGCPPLKFFWFPKYNISDPDTATPLVWPDTTTFYYAAVLDSAGCEAMDEIFEVYVSATSTKENLNKRSNALIFSNPLPDRSVFRVDCPDARICTILVYDILGKLEKLITVNQNGEFILDLSSGLYFFRLQQDEVLIDQGKLIME